MSRILTILVPKTLLLCRVLVFALTVSSAQASPIVAVIPGAGGFQNHQYNFNSSIGWEFTLSSPLEVSALGYFDAGNNGLFDPHPVGIFRNDGSLLFSATVPSGTSGTLVDGFRFVPIPATVLPPGTYRIAGYANSTSLDDFRFGVPSSTTIPGLAVGGAFEAGGNSLAFPNQNVGPSAVQGYFGPNFLATPAVATFAWHGASSFFTDVNGNPSLVQALPGT
jgi:hypothetical protein